MKASILPQAILYQDGKALGRLVQPRIATDICSAADAEDEAAFKATLLAELQYHLWQPAADKDIPPRALQILLDAHFKESSYSIKVFGQARGALFPVPLPYHLSGQRTTAAVSFAYQQQQYIRRQQLRWHTADSSPAPTGEISSVTVVCGELFIYSAQNGMTSCSFASSCVLQDLFHWTMHHITSVKAPFGPASLVEK